MDRLVYPAGAHCKFCWGILLGYAVRFCWGIGMTARKEKTMKKSITVSNLTLSLWLEFVRPVLRTMNMLEEVPAKDNWHEYTAEVIDEATADEITHCMTVACFNAHGKGKYATIEEAAQTVYQMEVSATYRKTTSDAIRAIREQLAYKVAEAITEAES